MELSQEEPQSVGLTVLVEVAQLAAGRWPGLAPLGGRRWTQEDIDHGVSIVFEVAQTGAFKARFPHGIGCRMSKAYLLVAVRNRLLRERSSGRVMTNACESTLDGFPAKEGDEHRSEVIDASSLRDLVVGEMPKDELAELLRRLRRSGNQWSAGDPLSPRSSRTARRHWSKAREFLRAQARALGLSREEVGLALAMLTGPNDGSEEEVEN